MRTYAIKSPNGQILRVSAHSYYHAIQLAVILDDWKFTNADYFKLNPKSKTKGK
jgi:hypothetical protein